MLTRGQRRHNNNATTDQYHNNITSQDNDQTQIKLTKNTGHWNQEEQLQYFLFLVRNKEMFLDKQARRTQKIFRQLGRCIKTRGADQCRSHHQKMQNKYPDFNQLLQFLKSSCQAFQKDVLKMLQNQQTKNCSTVMNPNNENFNQIKEDGQKIQEVAMVFQDPILTIQYQNPFIEQIPVIDLFQQVNPLFPF